jgi:hypothetical protein
VHFHAAEGALCGPFGLVFGQSLFSHEPAGLHLEVEADLVGHLALLAAALREGLERRVKRVIPGH